MSKVKALNINDIEQIQPLWMGLNEVHYRHSNYWKDHFATYSFEERMKKIQEADDFSIFCSRDGDELTGYCICSVRKGAGEIDSIFVREQKRNSSVGRQLAENALAWLAEKKVAEIRVTIAEGNESVMGFYQKLGFLPYTTTLKIKP
ncbi:MAG: GNAT family N-acetyltransferase [Desulfobulbaceae bacterium]|nr:MAG: GNAT family N-acetyltransferase [Desulfobulbaceae bacterium]